MARFSLPGRSVAALLAFALLAGPALAQNVPVPAAGTPPTQFGIGYVQLADDPRYDDDYAYNMVPMRPLGRPFAGAQLGIGDGLMIGQAINVNFNLQQVIGASVDELATAVSNWIAAGTHFVIADLPADALLQLADRFAGQPVTILNVAAGEDRLRGADCRVNVVHTIPSKRMLVDATVQFLVFHRWRNILVLQGPHPDDQLTVDALRESANFFGARIVNVKPFILSMDARERDQNNVALITAGENYDVVFLADADGDFGRYVEYETSNPRPVVFSAGLTPVAWHWSWERQGAPQVNQRFEDLAGRRMADVDWAAWAAVRALTQSVLRSRSTEYPQVLDYLLSDRLNLDGTKGYPSTFRAWDHQLRQPILMATGNAIIQLTPMDGFLHQTNDLDTLGVDAPQSTCRF